MLFVVTTGLFAPLLGNGFVSYDDEAYVVSNPQVNTGLGFANARWAATSMQDRNWMPLTRLSYQIDCSLWGLAPRFHHLMSALYHGIAAIALAMVLRSMGLQPTSTFLAAALFAVHPVQVESVAWAAARKDVLAAIFCFLAIWRWLAWLESGSRRDYWTCFCLVAASLLCKQAAVGLPLLFLVLARRARRGPGMDVSRAARVLWPFVALALATGLLTLLAQRNPGAQQLLPRQEGMAMAHAPWSVVSYLGAVLWPAGLNYLHVLALPVPLWKPLAGFLVLLCLTWLIGRVRAKHPLVWTGWVWLLLLYLPASGLIPFGPQAWAERFGYVAMGGISLMLGGALEAIRASGGWSRLVLVGTSAAIVVLGVLTARQQAFWRSSECLFQRAIRVDPSNGYARFHLAGWLERNHRSEEAFRQYADAVRATPDFWPARYNYACGLMGRRRHAEALEAIRPVPGAIPRWPEAHLVLANALYETGDARGALRHYEEAARLKPSLLVAKRNARTLRESGVRP